MGEQCVFLALPCRPRPCGGALPAGRIECVRPVGRGRLKVARGRCSLLTLGFNRLWAEALNCRRAAGLTHWAMQHDDVVPPPGWADVLIDEMDRHGADVCSAVVPIKDPRGLTSTGVRNADTGDVRRLTMAEAMALPETFALADVQAAGMDEPGPGRKLLAVNTGLWVCRFTESWVEPPVFPGFCVLDRLGRREGGDGSVRFQAACLSEDWAFSEWLDRRRLKAVATRKVALAHVDDAGTQYRNDHAWGEWQTDRGDQ